MDISKFIKLVPNFPIQDIMFRDISPLLANPQALEFVINNFRDQIDPSVDLIIGPDSRGFIFGTPVALLLQKPFIMARKPNKLPGEVLTHTYSYEYGGSTIEIQKNMIKPGQRVVIIDDVMATGGTTRAIVDLIHKVGAKVEKILVLIELEDLNGREHLHEVDVPLYSLLKY